MYPVKCQRGKMILLRRVEKNALLELKTFDRIFSASKVAQKHFFKKSLLRGLVLAVCKRNR